jgi:peroxiredoxin Q/BCP
VFKALRTIAATVSGIAGGVFHMVTRTDEPSVELKAGDVAPDFSLPGSDGRTYRLRDLAGHIVVVAWFPKAFTGGWTAECKSLGTSGAALGRFDARYFAASVDAAETNAKFAASLGIEYPILSDPTKAVARAYGVLAPSGMASRWTVYIGRDGRILDVDKKVRAASHGADVATRLQEFTEPVRGS